MLFFLAVSGLILAAILNPDGGVTFGAPELMAFPWSILTLIFASGTPAVAVLTLFFGGINAAILYAVMGWIFRVHNLGRAVMILAVVATFITGMVWERFDGNRSARSKGAVE